MACSLVLINYSRLKSLLIASSLIVSSNLVSDYSKLISITLLFLGWSYVLYILHEIVPEMEYIYTPAIVTILVCSVALVVSPHSTIIKHLLDLGYMVGWLSFGYSISKRLDEKDKWLAVAPIIIKIMIGMWLKSVPTLKPYSIGLNILTWMTISLLLSVPHDVDQDCLWSLQEPYSKK